MIAMNPSQNTTPRRTVVFFDGGCALCSREIRWLRSLDRRQRVQWIDINLDMTLLDAFGIDYVSAMRRFHVLDRSGILRVGAPAFLTLWSELPLLKPVARMVYATRSVALLDRWYERFASWRLLRRSRTLCQASIPEPGAAFNASIHTRRSLT